MKIIINGACGQMGQALSAAIAKSGDEIAAAVDKYAENAPYKELSEYEGEADVIVDFSHHSAAEALCAYAVRRKLPLVIATTGHTDEELARIHEAAKSVPVFLSANMSLGVALLIELAKKTVSVFPDADIEIVETHHRRKLDAPSGTAKMIVEGIREVRPEKKAHCGRAGMEKREKDEIGVQSVRMGNIVGIHEVHVCTDNQVLTLRHEAQSRALFADGALSAAKFLVGKVPGVYAMKDLV